MSYTQPSDLVFVYQNRITGEVDAVFLDDANRRTYDPNWEHVDTRRVLSFFNMYWRSVKRLEEAA